MTDERAGGAALIAGAIGFIVTMALHPTAHDLFAPGAFEHAARINVLAHSLALVALTVSFAGTLALTRQIGGALAHAALVANALGALCAAVAAILSGFVATHVAGELVALAPDESDATLRTLLDYTSTLNHAFAPVWLVASSVALVAWSAALVRGSGLARGLGAYGLVLGPLIVGGMLVGHLRLDVHGVGVMVAAQSLWFIAAGCLLWRRVPEKS